MARSSQLGGASHGYAGHDWNKETVNAWNQKNAEERVLRDLSGILQVNIDTSSSDSDRQDKHCRTQKRRTRRQRVTKCMPTQMGRITALTCKQQMCGSVNAGAEVYHLDGATDDCRTTDLQLFKDRLDRVENQLLQLDSQVKVEIAKLSQGQSAAEAAFSSALDDLETRLQAKIDVCHDVISQSVATSPLGLTHPGSRARVEMILKNTFLEIGARPRVQHCVHSAQPRLWKIESHECGRVYCGNTMEDQEPGGQPQGAPVSAYDTSGGETGQRLSVERDPLGTPRVQPELRAALSARRRLETPVVASASFAETVARTSEWVSSGSVVRYKLDVATCRVRGHVIDISCTLAVGMRPPTMYSLSSTVTAVGGSGGQTLFFLDSPLMSSENASFMLGMLKPEAGHLPASLMLAGSSTCFLHPRYPAAAHHGQQLFSDTSMTTGWSRPTSSRETNVMLT